MSTTKKILDRLSGVKETSTGWVARCPAHDDHDPSLSIREGADGRVLLKCFTGCDHKKIVALVTYVATQSKGMPVNLPQAHPEEKRMYEVGKRAFFYRAGPYDFACATCHAADNTRIRLQGLPNLTKNEPAGAAFTSWPAYRVSNSQLWPMQKRLEDCFRQQRFPYVEFGSEVTVALSTYMGVNGKGVKSLAPTIKR